MAMKLLFIEDDPGISLALRQALSTVYDMAFADTGAVGISKALTDEYDSILLDLNLPDMHGLEVCKVLRGRNVTAPIIILTADTAVLRKITLLDAGADDYLTKPFSLGELKARLRMLDRRVNQSRRSQLPRIDYDELSLDTDTHTVIRSGTTIKLRRKEFGLLQCLLQHAGTVVTRESLASHAWPENTDRYTNTIDVHIKYLRDKIDRPFKTPFIKTVHGLGYKLEAPRAVAKHNKRGKKYERTTSSSAL